MDRFLEIAGLVTRWLMAALACWWFFWFITLIGSTSDSAQYIAGTALIKAVICGGAAGIWFYRARTAKATKSLTEHLKRSPHLAPKEQQSAILAPDPPQVTSTPELTDVTPASAPPQDSPLPDFEQPTSPSEGLTLTAGAKPPHAWVVPFGFIIAVLALGLTIVYVARDSSVHTAAPHLTGGDANQSVPLATPSCPAGLPAGVQIVQIDDLTTITGSQGKLSHEPEESREAWHFSFRVQNQTAFNRPDRTFNGYCITSLELDVKIRSEDGQVWDLTGKQNLDSPYTYLSPGWSQEFNDLDLGTYKNPRNGNLSTWRITKAWGFPLNPVASLFLPDQ